MKIKGLRNDGWPRLVTLGDILTKEEYRTLQSGGVIERSDEDGAALIGFINYKSSGPLCEEVTSEGDE